MPFTVSHTVAVIPLYKYLGKFGAMSALIIGSITPDIAYLTPFLVHQRVDSHSMIGVFLFCIPMGLTVYFLYHLLMAPVIVSILPNSIKMHLSPDLFLGRVPNVPSHIVFFAIVIGSLTHIVWDFFTHQTGIPQFVHWMDVPLATVDGYNIMPYRLLQHFSSLFGLTLLIFWIAKWHQRKNHKSIKHQQIQGNHWHASEKLRSLTIIILLLLPLLGGILYGYSKIPESSVLYGLYAAQVFVKFAFVGAAGSFLITSIMLGLYYQYQIRSAL